MTEEIIQPKNSFFKRFWWILLVILIIIVGVSMFVYTAINRKNDDQAMKATEFAWPDPNAKTITAMPLDSTQIKSISKFRGCSGHDRAGYDFGQVLESDRSMKHYVYPIPELQGTIDKIKLFAPFDSTVAMVQWVNPEGNEVKSDWLKKNGQKEFGQIQKTEGGGRKNSGYDIDLVSSLDENAVFGFRHVNFIKQYQIGDTVKAGELIGYASVSEKENDFDIDYVGRDYKQEGDKRIEILDSMFDHMTPAVLAEFAKYGITSENTKFSKEYRDSNPCGYDTVTKYGSSACKESEEGGSQDSGGRNNDCWIQLKQ